MAVYEWKERDENPSSPGLYPIMFCYGTSEGAWPGAGEWNGERWDDDRGIFKWIDHRCETENEANTIASAHDVGW